MGIAESERASEREPLEGIEAWLTRQRLQSGDPKTQLNGEPRALGGVETWLAREQSVEKIDQLSMYIRTVWFVCEAAQFAMLAAGSIAAGGAPPLLSSVRMVGALLAARWPTLFVVFVVHALSNAQRLQRWPVQWDCEVWSLLVDNTLLLACLRAWTCETGRCVCSNFFRGLSIDERNAAFGRFALIARTQLAFFYGAAGFWKLNTSFLNHRTSCAPIFFYQLIAAYVPPAWLEASSPIATAIGHAAPANTLLVEFMIPLMLICGPKTRRIGVAMGILFHMMIAVTPPPNNASGFSLTAAKYLFLVLASTSSQAAYDLLSPSYWSSTLGAVRLSVLFGVLAAAAKVGSHEFYFDFFCPSYVLTAAVLVRTVVLAGDADKREAVEDARKPSNSLGWKFISLIMIMITFVYAFGGPLTGLMDQQSVNMYSNLRIHGGSNHLLVPTGLALGSDLVPGGIVRVIASTSPTILKLYPAEVTDLLTPRTREYLRNIGHSSRQFNAMKRRILGPNAIPPDHTLKAALRGAPLAVPFTLPAIELLRLLREARANGESFRIVYTHLTGMRGDEAWRQNGGGPTIRYSEDATDNTSACTSYETSDGPYLPCTPGELALLPPPPWWRHKLLLLQPYPILAGEGWGELHCFGP